MWNSVASCGGVALALVFSSSHALGLFSRGPGWCPARMFVPGRALREWPGVAFVGNAGSIGPKACPWGPIVRTSPGRRRPWGMAPRGVLTLGCLRLPGPVTRAAHRPFRCPSGSWHLLARVGTSIRTGVGARGPASPVDGVMTRAGVAPMRSARCGSPIPSLGGAPGSQGVPGALCVVGPGLLILPFLGR